MATVCDTGMAGRRWKIDNSNIRDTWVLFVLEVYYKLGIRFVYFATNFSTGIVVSTILLKFIQRFFVLKIYEISCS